MNEPQSENPIEAYMQLRRNKKENEQKEYRRAQSVDKSGYRNQNYNSTAIVFPSMAAANPNDNTSQQEQYTTQTRGRERAYS